MPTDHSDPPPLAERRPSPRRRTLLGCYLVYAEGRLSLPCTIRNISANGMRIAFTPGTTLPASIYLINARDRTVHHARIIWAKDAEAGVEIDETFPANALPAELAYLNRFVAQMGTPTAWLT